MALRSWFCFCVLCFNSTCYIDSGVDCLIVSWVASPFTAFLGFPWLWFTELHDTLGVPCLLRSRPDLMIPIIFSAKPFEGGCWGATLICLMLLAVLQTLCLWSLSHGHTPRCQGVYEFQSLHQFPDSCCWCSDLCNMCINPLKWASIIIRIILLSSNGRAQSTCTRLQGRLGYSQGWRCAGPGGGRDDWQMQQVFTQCLCQCLAISLSILFWRF